MRMMMLGGAALLLGGGAYLAGAFDGGEYYPMAPDAVEARLAGLQFGPELGSTGSGGINLVLRSRGPSMLLWDLTMGGKKAGEVRANLAPENTGTRVVVGFQFTDGESLMGLEEDPLLNDVAEIAMAEKVDSTLEGRAFNAELVQAKMAAVIVSNPQSVASMHETLYKNVGKEMDELAPDPVLSSSYSSSKNAADVSKTHGDGGWGKNKN